MDMSENQQGTTRREFLRKAAVAAAGAAAAVAAPPAKSSVYSLAPARVIGANDRIIIGHVGIGGQGGTHLNLLKQNAGPGPDSLNNNTEQIAVCDLYRRRMRAGQKALNLKDSQAFEDYRKLLEIKDIDAVWVTTSDQWHAPIAIDAMNAGKHVYIEKPMCKTLEEAFAIYDTCKRTKRVLQVGSQGCSDPKYKAVAELVKSGKYGKLVMVQGSYNRNSLDGEWNYYHIDEDAGPHATGDAYVNWDVFRRGKGPKEWDPDMFFRWRKWWEIGSGLVGDLLPHRLHPHYIAMGIPLEGTEGFPFRVASFGGLYVQKTNPVTKKPDRNVPDFINVIADFEGGPSIMEMVCCINEQGWTDTIRLNKATITFQGDTIDVKPERVYADEVDAYSEQVPGGEPIDRHQRNFLDCIRNGGTPNCGIDLAVRVQTIISLAELSYRNGVAMHFDPKTRRAWFGAQKDPYYVAPVI